MKKNPSHFAATGPGKDFVIGLDTSTHPAELVSWNDAAEFCAKLSEQEWTVRQGQAVWRRAKGSPEIAGELLVGTRTNGEAFVQFTKTPFPVVIAQKTSDEWQIQAPAQNETHVGPGKPPERIIWFGLAQALAGDALPRQWSWRYDSNSWSLENRTSGESLSGYFLEKSAARAGVSR